MFKYSSQVVFAGIFLMCFLESKSASENCIQNAEDKKPITIFVHGTTLNPINALLTHTLLYPRGLTNAHDTDKWYRVRKLPTILSRADSGQFPLETFYVFGWSGKLSYKARKQAAQNLYKQIKELSLEGPITLIGHSHGGNVALNVARIAEEHNDTDFKIERLILLATPVQRVTARYLMSPLYKKVYSFYSMQDIIQVMDPQGLYKTTKKLPQGKLFSERVWPHAAHMVQTSIKFDFKHPFHLNFVFGRFLKQLPYMLDMLDKASDSDNQSSTYCINIPHKGMPHFTQNTVLRKEVLLKRSNRI